MRKVLLLSLIVPSLQLTGCDSLQKKHDNPVLVAAPRRVQPEEGRAAEDEKSTPIRTMLQNSRRKTKGADIRKVRHELDQKPLGRLEG